MALGAMGNGILWGVLRKLVLGCPDTWSGKLGIIHHKSEIGKGSDSELSGNKPGTDLEELCPSPQKDLLFCV